jgi:hypothetical protein
MRKALRRSQECTPLGLFSALKRRNRAGNEPPPIGPKKIGKTVWKTTRMLSMVFEVIQPDLEVDGRHATTFLISSTGSSVRAASGNSVEQFGQILAAGAAGPRIYELPRQSTDQRSAFSRKLRLACAPLVDGSVCLAISRGSSVSVGITFRS